MSSKDANDKASGKIMEDASKLHGMLLTLRFFIEKLVSLSEGPIKTALNK